MTLDKNNISSSVTKRFCHTSSSPPLEKVKTTGSIRLRLIPKLSAAAPESRLFIHCRLYIFLLAQGRRGEIHEEGAVRRGPGGSGLHCRKVGTVEALLSGHQELPPVINLARIAIGDWP